MLTSITVDGFRSFEHVAVSNLGRINLLVGENCAGKTSLLEAIRLFGAGGHPSALLASALDRGEYDIEERDEGPAERMIALRFAFFGRMVHEGGRFVIDGCDASGQHRIISANIVDVGWRDPEAPVIVDSKSMEDPDTGFRGRSLFPEWAVRIVKGPDRKDSIEIPINWSASRARQLSLPEPRSSSRLPVLLKANSLDDAILSRLWDKVAATPAKQQVVAALRGLERFIQDIDLRADREMPFRSRVVVRLSDDDESAVPIGSLGEGITWIFALALGAAATPSNLLLVDDIDAGLHHRVMDGMWKMVLTTARRRNLQVFATTHSIDCLTALKRICAQDETAGNDVRVVRLVKGGPTTGITFTAAELATAIEGEVEVRG
jgi:hypothetical protein